MNEKWLSEVLRRLAESGSPRQEGWANVLQDGLRRRRAAAARRGVVAATAVLLAGTVAAFTLPGDRPTTPAAVSGPNATDSLQPAPATEQSAAAGGATAPTPRTVVRPEAPVSPRAAIPVPPAPGKRTTSTAPGRPPLVLAHIGDQSSDAVEGRSDVPALLRAWAAGLESRGGINGRTVRLLIGDDHGEPERARALLRQFVDRDGADALVAVLDADTTDALRAEVERRALPVVGGIPTGPAWTSSPMFFPFAQAVQPAALTLLPAAVGEEGQAAAARKFGLLYCAELTRCQETRRRLIDEGGAAAQGFDPVYDASISLAQPDFTAHCSEARDRGVEVLAVDAELATLTRVANSCRRIGFEPQFVAAAAIGGAGSPTSPDGQPDPSVEGLLAPTLGVPWTARTAATAGYRALLGSARPAPATMAAWLSTQLVERALRSLSAPTPSSRNMLEALWSINESLPGLTAKLTFRHGHPAQIQACSFGVRYNDGAWLPIERGSLICPRSTS